MKLSKPHRSGIENYELLQKIKKLEQMSSIRDFLCCYNKEDVGPTLEAIRKMINFHYDKDIHSIKTGCTLPNLADICLHKSTDTKYYPITEADRDLLEKTEENVVGGTSIVFTRKAVFEETFIRKSNEHMQSNCGD